MLHGMIAAIAPQVAEDAGDGLTWSDVLSDLPTDPASLVVMALCIGVVVWVIRAGRSSGPKNPTGPAAGAGRVGG